MGRDVSRSARPSCGNLSCRSGLLAADALRVADHRFSIRHAAITLLDAAGMGTQLKRLLPILRQPPFVNWAVRLALLGTEVVGCADRRDLQALAEIDNVHVAAAAARGFGRQIAANGGKGPPAS